MSSRVMSLLSSFAPEMEIYSIDEAFLKFEGCKYLNLQEYGLMIVKTVTKSTGVPVSIGIAKTKALSKVATKVAKKFPERTGGVYLIDDDEKRIKAKKNIATTRSFEKQYTEIEELRERISTFSVTCAEKLRSQGSCCNALLVFLHTNWFRKDLPQYSRNIVMQLPYPTNSSIEIARFAKEGLALIFKKGYQYKKAGVIVMDITPAAANQISFFENSNPKHKVLMEVIDRLNASIGQKKVKLASQALDRTWKMKQERLSPRYSTRFSEIITIYT
jgi:nucleotidyltransferase/DNA polymerase involved in DNA repair